MQYANSVMTTYYDDQAGADREPCVVIFRDIEIVIEYLRDGRPSKYCGKLEGDQYHLFHWPQIEGFVGEAHLSRPGENVLDGTWSERENGLKSTGTWDIELRE